MITIRLIHWNAEEAAQRAKRITSTRYKVDHQTPAGPDAVRNLLASPPDAFVIDLSRLPGQGRDLGIILRTNRTTRKIPIVFVNGDPEKVKQIRKLLPDAVYSDWSHIDRSINRALQHVPSNPLVPESLFAGYAGKPLVQKLGIKSKMKVGLLHAPKEFEAELGSLPSGTILSKNGKGRCSLILWFVRSKKELESQILTMAKRNDYKSLWIIWPKKSSTNKSDLSQQIVRRAGLDSGLVDYKICSVDAIWSGLLFTHRKNK